MIPSEVNVVLNDIWPMLLLFSIVLFTIRIFDIVVNKKEFHLYKDLIKEQSLCEKSIQEWSEIYKTILPNDVYLSNLVKEEGDERAEAQNVAPWNGKQIIELRETL